MDIEEEAQELVDRMDEIKNEAETMSTNHEKLVSANKKLVKLVLTMEQVMKHNGIELDELQDSGGYSYGEGWKSAEEKHEEKMEIGEHIESSEILDQIQEVEHLLGELEIYK